MWIRLLECLTSLSWTPPHIVRDRTGRCAAVDQSRAQRVVPGQLDGGICRGKQGLRPRNLPV